MTVRVEDMTGPCRVYLEEAVERVAAEDGVVYAVAGEHEVQLVVSARGEGAPARDQYEAVARGVIRSGVTQLATAAPADDGEIDSLLAVPCEVDDEVVAVLVVRRRRGSRAPADADVARLGSTLPIALAVDRYRMHAVLAERMSQAESIRRQLDAYAVDLRATYLAERSRSDELFAALGELKQTYAATVRGLAIAVESKDAYTGGHLHRVSRYGMALTAVVAPEHADDVQFEYGFLLHDVGKLVVPDAVLVKAGPLTDDEWVLMQSHAEAGRTILNDIPFLAEAREIVYAHHEHWDGCGYPRGLQGEQIPLGARIFPLVDAFDTMTTTRPYRAKRSVDQARAELARASGSQFWPDAVEAFMSLPAESLTPGPDAVRFQVDASEGSTA